MVNIFLAVFFVTLLCVLEPFFFIGYLFSIAIFDCTKPSYGECRWGLDNAKKIVEVEMKAKGTPLHDAQWSRHGRRPVQRHFVVALNPVIKFTTLFGLLAVELAVELGRDYPASTIWLSVGFFVFLMFFVHRSFYGMRIKK